MTYLTPAERAHRDLARDIKNASRMSPDVYQAPFRAAAAHRQPVTEHDAEVIDIRPLLHGEA